MLTADASTKFWSQFDKKSYKSQDKQLLCPRWKIFMVPQTKLVKRSKATGNRPWLNIPVNFLIKFNLTASQFILFLKKVSWSHQLVYQRIGKINKETVSTSDILRYEVRISVNTF